MAKGIKTGGGSRKGIPNRITASTLAMIEGALEAGAGGQAFFEQQKIDNPVAFMSLVGKTLPKVIDSTVKVAYEGMTKAELDARLDAALAKLAVIRKDDTVL